MPKVGDKEFPYTPQGKEQAKAYAERTGEKVQGLEDSIPIQDSGARRQTYEIGGKIPGDEGFGINPNELNPIETGAMPEPAVYQEGGEVDEENDEEVEKYKKGGKVKEARKEKREAIKAAKEHKEDFLGRSTHTRREAKKQATRTEKEYHTYTDPKTGETYTGGVKSTKYFKDRTKKEIREGVKKARKAGRWKVKQARKQKRAERKAARKS